MTNYEQCAARDCMRLPRKWSRYCRYHYERIHRAGGINGRVLRAGALRPHQDICREWVDRNRDHPAVAAAVDWAASELHPTEGARFLAGEWERLREAGVEPEEILAAIIAVRLYDGTTSRPFNEVGTLDVNTGRAVLRCAPQRVTKVAASGRKDSKRTRASHARALGEYLRETLGALPLVAAQRIAEESGWIPKDTTSAIRDGLRVPFSPANEDAQEQ